jgi:predicted sulfurtransferase
MDYHYCGVVQVCGVHDGDGLACGRSASTLCYDCGTLLCPDHTERCDLCAEMFCPSCLSFHQSEHPKPAERDQRGQQKRKTA